MGRTSKPRLPVYSSNEPDSGWSLTTEQFQELEGLLRTGFSEDARAAMTAICRSYSHWKNVELKVGTQDEASKIWNEARERIEKLIEIGWGSFPPSTDAGRLVEELISDSMEAIQIELTERDLEPPTLDPVHSKGHVESAGLHLNVTRNFMMRLAFAFRAALETAERDRANWGEGFRPGVAFTDWATAMKDWAAQNGLPHAASSTGSPSRFARFLFALHRLLPADRRENVASEEAMNQRLRRLKERGSNTPRQG